MSRDPLGGLVDYGEEPAALREAQARKAAVMKDDDSPEESDTDLQLQEDDPEPEEVMTIALATVAIPFPEEPTPEEPAASIPNVVRRAQPDRKPTKRAKAYLSEAVTDKVRIKMPKLSMSMGILEFCVTDQALAFFVPLDTTFEPDLKTEIIITHNEREYTVVYAGGFFPFHELGFSLVSFLRVD